MKNYIIIILCVISSLTFQACEKESYGDKYGLTGESVPPYVELSSKTNLAVKQGNNATIQLRVRNAFTKPVTINYEVTGAFAKTGSVTLLANTLTVNAVVAVPTGLVTGSATATAVFTVKSASTADQTLRIGYLSTAVEKRSIVISN